jgi:hypothetical protein
MILMVSGHEHIGNPNKFGTGERAATYWDCSFECRKPPCGSYGTTVSHI